jgi:hypothetical protein
MGLIFKFNWIIKKEMQIGVEDIENVLVNMILGENFFILKNNN